MNDLAKQAQGKYHIAEVLRYAGENYPLPADVAVILQSLPNCFDTMYARAKDPPTAPVLASDGKSPIRHALRLSARPVAFLKARTAELFASGHVWIHWKHFDSRYCFSAKKRCHALPDQALFYA